MSYDQSFAAVYDLFMDNVPYDRWTENIREILLENGIRDGLVLDLCCGTGQLTRRLAAAGYDMIGIDASEEMLSVAKSSSPDEILYLCQDMRSFELYGTVRAIVSTFDSINYLQSSEELFTVLALADNYLDPGGLLLFDLNTPGKYRELRDGTFAENREEGSLIWENFYDEATGINESCLTFYLREEDGRFRRAAEVHEQYAFSTGMVREAMEKAGLKLLFIRDISEQDWEPEAPMKPESADARRLLFVAQECKKKKQEEG